MMHGYRLRCRARLPLGESRADAMPNNLMLLAPKPETQPHLATYSKPTLRRQHPANVTGLEFFRMGSSPRHDNRTLACPIVEVKRVLGTSHVTKIASSGSS